MLDLILRGARVIDPSQDIDALLDVGFADGRVAVLSRRIEDEARETRELAGYIVAPGFIDMHTHVYWGATSISIRGEEVAQRGGITTLIDAGSAGPGNFPGMRHYVIEKMQRRVLAFLNVAYPGIFAYSAPVMVGECTDMRLLDPQECVRTINENRDVIVGIKVRIGRVASGSNGTMPLDMAIEVGDETGLPVMVHIDHPPPSRRDVLMRMRPGDILTHCFRPFPNAPIRSSGEIWEDVLLARERGIVFDLGHGGSSFGYGVARAMLEHGFLPDVISTDVHVLNVNGPVFDLMTTLSKFHALGVDLKALIRCVTQNPARAANRPELGTLTVGGVADATIFEVERGEFGFADCFGEVVETDARLSARGVVCAGRWSEA